MQVVGPYLQLNHTVCSSATALNSENNWYFEHSVERCKWICWSSVPGKTIVINFFFFTGEWEQLNACFLYFVFGHWPLFPAANIGPETGCNDWGVSSFLQSAIPRYCLKLGHDCYFCIKQSLCNSDCMVGGVVPISRESGPQRGNLVV